jgi:hypothetical protein
MPRGGIARFYGAARIYKFRSAYDEVWRKSPPAPGSRLLGSGPAHGARWTADQSQGGG